MATNPEYLGLTSAALRFNIDGKYVHPATVWRWIRHGVKCGGQCICLGHVRMGRRLATTPQFIDEFMRALAEADHDESSSLEREGARSRPPVTTAKPRSAKRRAEDIARARRELAEAGV